jgi:RNase P subunit RPR2
MYNTTVICSNCGRVYEEDTKFINIEENILGEDVLTFICNKCGKKGESIVYG